MVDWYLERKRERWKRVGKGKRREVGDEKWGGGEWKKK